MIAYQKHHMPRKIFHFFDKLEDKIRSRLSHSPVLYATIGGIGVVLFWRGVWHMADQINLDALLSMIIGSIILLLSGAFVSSFIGSRLIVTGMTGEKKLAEKTSEEIEREGSELKHIEEEIHDIKKDLSEIKTEIEEKI
jgi:hypothetical protein